MALPGARPIAPRPLQRLLHKADFVRLLEVSAKERSAHFAIHHVASAPAALRAQPLTAAAQELSTAEEQLGPQHVDNVPDNAPDAVWIGCVVPKRHARRSVTRSLLKRQMRSAFERHAAGLPHGLWLLRLRSVFAPKVFASAASAALKDAARRELDLLLARAVASA